MHPVVALSILAAAILGFVSFYLLFTRKVVSENTPQTQDIPQ